jgi:hypothetical protein
MAPQHSMATQFLGCVSERLCDQPPVAVSANTIGDLHGNRRSCLRQETILSDELVEQRIGQPETSRDIERWTARTIAP